MGWLVTPPEEWTLDEADYSVMRILFRTKDPEAPHGITFVAHYRWVKSEKKHKGSLTEGAAKTLAETYQAAHPQDSVRVEQQNDAGAYRVVVHTAARGAWQIEAEG